LRTDRPIKRRAAKSFPPFLFWEIWGEKIKSDMWFLEDIGRYIKKLEIRIRK